MSTDLGLRRGSIDPNGVGPTDLSGVSALSGGDPSAKQPVTKTTTSRISNIVSAIKETGSNLNAACKSFVDGKFWLNKYEKRIVANVSAMTSPTADTTSKISLQLFHAYNTKGFAPDGSLTQAESLAKMDELIADLAKEKPMAGANFERDFDALKQNIARQLLSAVEVAMPDDKLDLATARQMVDKTLFLAKFPLNKFDGPKFDRDLTTPQQEKAVKTAFSCSAAMMLQEAQKKDSVFGQMDPKYNDRFKGLFTVLGDYVQKAKTGQADVKILKEIKGFA